MGNLQLALHRHFGGGGHAQLVGIENERLLHVLERVAQLVYLVLGMHLGQRSVEVAFGHLVGRCRQLAQRVGHLLDASTSAKVDDDEP